MPPLLHLTTEGIATHAANDFINRFCLSMEQGEKLRVWREVYDTLVAALTYQRDTLNARHRRELLDASAN